MSAEAVVALVRALDAIDALDAASREEKSQIARRVLSQAPTAVIRELVDATLAGGAKLASKLRREDLSIARRLAYVGACAVNAKPTERQPKAEPERKADRDWRLHEREEVRRTLREQREYRDGTRDHERPTPDQVRSWRERLAPRPSWDPDPPKQKPEAVDPGVLVQTHEWIDDDGPTGPAIFEELSDGLRGVE